MPGAPSDSRQTLDSSGALARVQFHSPDIFRQAFQGLTQRISPDLAAALPGLLAETPDPDGAIALFDRLVGAGGTALCVELERHRFLAHYAIAVFGNSRYLGETLLRNTDLLLTFINDRTLDRSLSRDEFVERLRRFRSLSEEPDFPTLLARFKREEYVRIMLRDILNIAPLAETTAEISALADVLVETALREAESRLQSRFDLPQHIDGSGRPIQTPFAVLALGKLGGNELNYCSDLDLLYVYGDDGDSASVSISSTEYFIRLAQELTELLSRLTPEGAIFRIDLRLRPQGNEGELVVSLKRALRYYAGNAHDWELQALIKLRHCAGDTALAHEFIRGIHPHVYRQELNFAAVKTALISRERIHKRRRSPLARARAGGVDVKLDPGGIRDIEFLVQCLQRTYGGSEPWLRSGGTLFSLQKLHDKSHITGNEFHELTATYEFLRHLEHRLQWRWGRQTHTLPTGPAEVSVLHRSMINLVSGQEHFDDLPATVRRRMAQVAEIYERVVYQQQSRQERERAGEGFQLRRCEAGSAGQTNQQILERLAYDAPALYAIASRDDLSPQARRGLFRFLGSAFTSSERYAQVLREAPAVSHAVKIFAASDYLTEILVRHPEEIASLARLESRGELPQTNSLFDRSSHREIQSSDPILEYLAASSASYGDQLASLRQHYRHRVFCSGARDLTGVSDIYESLAVTTAAAEDAIAAAVRIAGQPPALAVMGLGRLGSGEFDLLSDADLLFVCQENSDRWTLSKSAELIIQTLSAYTRHGMVFPVDTRLRPRGGEGELLVTPSQLEAYFLQEAQPWEALSYSKLRWIAGSQPVAGQALSVTQTLFRRFASDAGFARAVRGMRARLEEAERGDPSFKGSPGGVYDIDFVVSYLLVKHTIEITNGSLRERIWRCVEKGILKREDAVVLDRGAALFRSVEHYVRLVTGRRRKWLPGSGVGRSTIEEFLARVLGETFSGRLESHLQDTLQQVRQVYDRVLT